MLTFLIGPPSLEPQAPGPSASKDPWLPPPWPPHSQPLASGLVSEEAVSCPDRAGSLTQGPDGAVTPDPRWVPGGWLWPLFTSSLHVDSRRPDEPHSEAPRWCF